MSHSMMKTAVTTALALSVLAMMAGGASAADFYLRAEGLTKNMPDPNGGPDLPVPMWGFALDDSFEGTELEAADVPGPRLVVPPGDTTLTIHLDNNLSVPISIVIRGQTATMTPTFFTDDQGRQRVYSFTHETPAGNATQVTYTWTGLKPGTYLYHSGTHPQVQVQMGLYGGVTRDAAAGEVYSGIPYDEEVVLLYSEIDPVLHEQVDDGSYGTTGMTSTIDYSPKYFLINGEPYTASTAPIAAGNVGDRVLIRFLNAGLRTLTPTLLGAHMSVIAEDGNVYPYPRQQYSLALPAGQTKDAIVEFPASGTYPVYERRGSLTSAGGSSPGGMLRFLEVGP